MQRLKVSGAVRPIYGSLGIKWLKYVHFWTMNIYTVFGYLVLSTTMLVE